MEESIDTLTSTEQVATYATMLRDALWPGGRKAAPVEPRSAADRARTRVEARAKMLAIVPDDLKRLVGSQTAKRGVLRLVDMFQYPQLNKRLVYVTLEAFLGNLFAGSKIQDALRRLHDAKGRKKA